MTQLGSDLLVGVNLNLDPELFCQFRQRQVTDEKTDIDLMSVPEI